MPIRGDHTIADDLCATRQIIRQTDFNRVVVRTDRHIIARFALAIDQLADAKTDKPSVVKAVTLEVAVTDGEKVALASTVGTLSLLLRKAGSTDDADTRRVTSADLGQSSTPKPDSKFVTVAVIRPTKNERVEFTVPAERGNALSAALSRPAAVGE